MLSTNYRWACRTKKRPSCLFRNRRVRHFELCDKKTAETDVPTSSTMPQNKALHSLLSSKRKQLSVKFIQIYLHTLLTIIGEVTMVGLWPFSFFCVFMDRDKGPSCSLRKPTRTLGSFHTPHGYCQRYNNRLIQTPRSIWDCLVSSQKVLNLVSRIHFASPGHPN